MKFTFIDLFSGIGGFRMALESIGGECLNYSEINKDAINTYCLNFDEPLDKNLGDITKINNLPSHNILTAGVPCQSWSIAGKNLGFDDDRGKLWNDTIYLLNHSKPDAFIFENVKGLVDPRNKTALNFILEKIKESGYYVDYHVINSFDYGVPQNRIRVYIVGFKNKEFFDRFKIPKPIEHKVILADILNDFDINPIEKEEKSYLNLFGEVVKQKSMSMSSNNGFNDYFMFNDLRNGQTTIHSWDIQETTQRQKEICYLLLKNRRKRTYGTLDGNPLSLSHFQNLDTTITEKELVDLVNLKIFKKENYSLNINDKVTTELNEEEKIILSLSEKNYLVVDKLKTNRELKLKKTSIPKTINGLIEKGVLVISEERYDFKNTKISTGLNGVCRVFLKTSDVFSTLVSSDTNDFITNVTIDAKNGEDYKKQFIEKVYNEKNYRRITKEEACMIQGFPKDYRLPENRNRWMKLVGNSISVPVVEMIGKSILDTGVFDNR